MAALTIGVSLFVSSLAEACTAAFPSSLAGYVVPVVFVLASSVPLLSDALLDLPIAAWLPSTYLDVKAITGYFCDYVLTNPRPTSGAGVLAGVVTLLSWTIALSAIAVGCQVLRSRRAMKRICQLAPMKAARHAA